MAYVFKPPKKLDMEKIKNNLTIFLAGSIEQGKAMDWQQKVTNAVMDFDVCILNPRRDSWDDSWEQSIDNPQFKEQVTWELDGLDVSDIIIIYFDPETKSPISLLELGLHAHDKNVIVVCEEPFYRKGNVDIVCEKYGITQVKDLSSLIGKLQKVLRENH